MIVKNASALAKNSKGFEKERKIALNAVEAALKAINAQRAVSENVKLHGNQLVVQGKKINLKKFEQIFVIGFGKASAQMAAALEKILGKQVAEGCVNSVEKKKLKKIKVVKARHPIPNSAGLNGARKILALAKKAREKDLVITLVSGGGSALLPLPAKGISLQALQKMNKLLVNSRATINEINAVRKHISQVKGGQLMKAIYPATCISLIVSDVVKDDLQTIASGPTVADKTTFRQAINVLKKHRLWKAVPAAVKKHLLAAKEETPKPKNKIFKKCHNFVILNNKVALKEMKKEAKKFKLKAKIYSTSLEGEARKVGARLVNKANKTKKPCLLLAGGETTVTIKGKGIGGRNQEIVMGALEKLRALKKAVFVSIATDGIDGNSKAAGAIADSNSFKRAKAKGLNPRNFLARNDSNTFFKKLGDEIITGPTETNVMDLQLLLIY